MILPTRPCGRIVEPRPFCHRDLIWKIVRTQRNRLLRGISPQPWIRTVVRELQKEAGSHRLRIVLSFVPCVTLSVKGHAPIVS